MVILLSTVVDVATSCSKEARYLSVVEGESLNDTTKFVEIIWARHDSKRINWKVAAS